MIRGFDRLVGFLARLGAALAALALLASLGLIGYSVVMRYFVGRPVPWVDEIVGYLLVASVMLAAADALRSGEHIAVDVLTERLSARGRWLTLVFGLVAVGVCAALLVQQGMDTVAFSRMVGLLSNSALAVPMWIPQALLPLGGALLLLAAVAGLLVALRDRRPPPPDDRPTPGLE